jgi:hypothetical protein
LKHATYLKFERPRGVRSFFNKAAWPETDDGARDFYYEIFQTDIDCDFIATPVRVEGVDAAESPDNRATVSQKVFRRDLKDVYKGFTGTEIDEIKTDLQNAGFSFEGTHVTGFERKKLPGWRTP